MEVTFTLQFGRSSVEILCGHSMSPVLLDITPPHNHRQGELHVILSGSADYTVDNKNCVLKAGDFIYIPPKTYHGSKVLEADTTFAAFSLRGGPRQPVFSNLSEALLDGIHSACRESKATDTLQPLMPYFYILVGDILRPNGPTIRENQDYEGMILRYLDTHYNRDTTLASLAQYVGVSSKQVQRIVQKETGRTFLEELTARRMQAARYLEENTTMSSTEIAHYVGYNSYSGYWKARKNYLEQK